LNTTRIIYNLLKSWSNTSKVESKLTTKVNSFTYSHWSIIMKDPLHKFNETYMNFNEQKEIVFVFEKYVSKIVLLAFLYQCCNYQ